jgi:hypothetical protein
MSCHKNGDLIYKNECCKAQEQCTEKCTCSCTSDDIDQQGKGKCHCDERGVKCSESCACKDK